MSDQSILSKWQWAYENGLCISEGKECRCQNKEKNEKGCILGAEMVARYNKADQTAIFDSAYPVAVKNALIAYSKQCFCDIQKKAKECQGEKPVKPGDKNFAAQIYQKNFMDFLKKCFEGELKFMAKAVDVKDPFKKLFAHKKKQVDIAIELNGKKIYFEIKSPTFNDMGAALFEGEIIEKGPDDKFVILLRGGNSYSEFRELKNRYPVNDILDLTFMGVESVKHICDFLSSIKKI